MKIYAISQRTRRLSVVIPCLRKKLLQCASKNFWRLNRKRIFAKLQVMLSQYMTFIDSKLWNLRILGIKASYLGCFKISLNTPVKYKNTNHADMCIYLGSTSTYQKCMPILENKEQLTKRLCSRKISLRNAFNFPKQLKWIDFLQSINYTM